ncbi:MAG TPA: OmpA family protein [Bacillota bacterium]|nr:OmpA family protein [Bacillota bacterium]
MKKLLIVFLCSMMCLMIALPACAEWSLSLDYILGDSDLDLTGSPNFSTDINGLMFGVGYKADRFGVDFLYGSGDLDDPIGRDDNFSLGQVMGTYRFLQRGSFSLGATLSYADLENGNYSADGLLTGIKAEFYVNDRVNINVGLGYSLFGANVESSVVDYDDANITNAYLNFNYWFTDNWAMHFGYMNYRYDGEDSRADVDGSSVLYALGVKYRFGAAKKPVEEPKQVEEPKKEEPKVEEPKKEEPKEEPKVEEPKKEEPKQEPKVEEPKKEEVKPVEEPKPEVKEPDITQPPKENETPEEKVVRIEKVNEFLQPIFFNFDKSFIRKDQLPVLEKSLEVLKANSDLYILLGGHADPPGTNDYNMRLSQRRAETVRKWLVAHGIDANRITIVAYGEEYPYMAKSNDPQWESDRWVDIVMTVVAPTFETGLRK